MAIGDFLQGVGRAGRATAIGALRGRRKALDRAEEERKTATIERQRDVQNQLLQQLRTAQTDELAQLGVERTRAREALAADRQAQVNSFRERYANDPDRAFGPNVSDDLILIDAGSITNAALDGQAMLAMHGTPTGEDTVFAVVHAHRKVNHQLVLGLRQDRPGLGVQAHGVGGGRPLAQGHLIEIQFGIGTHGFLPAHPLARLIGVGGIVRNDRQFPDPL